MRADGRRIKTLDPLFSIIPHLIPKRYDAQVMSEVKINYSPIRKYISSKNKEGIDINFMSVFIAAYLRMIAQNPELNRFVMNKNIYARKEFWVSFVVLKQGDVTDDKIETVVKIKFDLTDTIFDVAKKTNESIYDNRKVQAENLTDRLASFFMGIPLLSRFLISFIKFCDKIGLLPKILIDGIPFHSLFITNMASINSGSVFHHLYDFGTTSIFISIGRMLNKAKTDGQKKLIIPVSLVVDERLTAGVTFAKAYSHMKKYLADPSLLEVPPAFIKQDIK